MNYKLCQYKHHLDTNASLILFKMFFLSKYQIPYHTESTLICKLLRIKMLFALLQNHTLHKRDIM